MLLVVAVACLIVAFTAILSIIESAIIYVDDLRLATILRNKPENKADIKYIIKNKEAHLSSMVMLITLISIAGSSLIGAIAARHFNDTGWPYLRRCSPTACLFLPRFCPNFLLFKWLRPYSIIQPALSELSALCFGHCSR